VALQTDIAAMGACNLPRDKKTDTEPFNAIGIRAAPERLEDILLMSVFDTDPLIGNGYPRLAVNGRKSDDNRLFLSVFQCIGDQISDTLLI